MARKRRTDETVNLRLRLPEGLRQALAAEAEEANRSLNSEILWRLGRTLGEEWQRFIAGVEQREKDDQERMDQMRQDPKFQESLRKIVEEHFAHIPRKGER
jgi:translation initiation factor 2 alpha subunit (eIF-2alpha)